MLNQSAYEGREQTYVKHFVLEKYLERVAFNIFSFSNNFVYVDGFSGPWKSRDENFEDTSFYIAVEQLRRVRSAIKDARGKDVNFRCMFIEKSGKAFQDLTRAVSQIDDVEIDIINGEFEDNVERICAFAGRTFSLIFVDPTGWTGFALERIEPLLNLRGEVLINFMFDHINRFLEDPTPATAKSYGSLFGGADWFIDWQNLIEEGISREAATIEIYGRRVKASGNFKYVTSTRIMKPIAERSYFYLLYATQSWKGISEFRAIEKKAIDEQENIRNAAKYRAEIYKTGQENLFGGIDMSATYKSYEDERRGQLERGKAITEKILQSGRGGIHYEDLVGEVLETPLVWESDLKRWLGDMRQNGQIDIPDLSGRERVPKIGYRIIPRAK